MPRDGNGVATKPAGTTATPNTLIESSKFNSVIDDIYALLNAALPITAGGTSAVSKQGAVSALFDGTTIVDDDNFTLAANGDQTKLLAFDLSGLTTATTRTLTLPDESARLALAPHLAGHLYGLTLSNNTTDATNDIDIAVGSAIDSTNTHIMTLASSITKRLDAAWAVGSGNGGLDTGSIANTTYHVHLIKRVDTGVVDVLFSASATAPTLPANYTLSRRIGSILRSGGTILQFLQYGDEFLYTGAVGDVNTSSLGTSISVYTLSVPPLAVAKVRVLLSLAAGQALAFLGTPGANDPTINSPAGNVTLLTPTGGGAIASHIDIRVSASSQIFAKSNQASTTLQIATYGWVDTRGRLA